MKSWTMCSFMPENCHCVIVVFTNFWDSVTRQSVWEHRGISFMSTFSLEHIYRAFKSSWKAVLEIPQSRREKNLESLKSPNTWAILSACLSVWELITREHTHSAFYSHNADNKPMGQISLASFHYSKPIYCHHFIWMPLPQQRQSRVLPGIAHIHRKHVWDTE